MTAQRSNAYSVAGRFYKISIIALIVLTAINLYLHISTSAQVIYVDTTASDYSYWLSVQKSHPSFRDGYLVLSQIKMREGDVLGAMSFEGEAVKIDPYLIPLSSRQ